LLVFTPYPAQSTAWPHGLGLVESIPPCSCSSIQMSCRAQKAEEEAKAKAAEEAKKKAAEEAKKKAEEEAKKKAEEEAKAKVSRRAQDVFTDEELKLAHSGRP